MNYALHYDRLIARASGRILAGYRERHHVLPRCMGGDDTKANLVYLTPEEHFVAHQLLVKIHPDIKKLANAAVLMAKHCSGNKAYGWLRRRHIEAIAESMRGNSHTKGKKLPPRTQEHCAKISAAKRGLKLSEEQKTAISAFHKGRKRAAFSPEAIANRRAAAKARRGRPAPNKGVPHSPEARAKMSAALKGRIISPEWAAKVAIANRGRKYPPRSPEWCAKISAAKRGKPGQPCSPETRAKISAAKRLRDAINAGLA